ncbi:PREDICTED: uncharacterized protein LOC108360048 [Rhagoletis zephyria]|uniref:uncharacterized protein LOC108360048 n=1 Tax=Rhagoletis zephyria TaxID=28612 RepID=UPI00081149A4|nr:PREDICTED: uncharacterized protein LOC108360048 [Rhagoletis zephyria]
MEAMAFLQRHVAPRRTLGNTSFVSKESFQSQAEHEVCESQSLFDNEDQTQFDSPIVTESSPPISSFEAHCVEEQTPSTSKQAKRKSDEDRLDKLYGAVSDWLQKSESTPKPLSRNADFLKVLDSYLLKHSEEVQDSLKIDIINFVFNSGQSA